MGEAPRLGVRRQQPRYELSCGLEFWVVCQVPLDHIINPPGAVSADRAREALQFANLDNMKPDGAEPCEQPRARLRWLP